MAKSPKTKPAPEAVAATPAHAPDTVIVAGAAYAPPPAPAPLAQLSPEALQSRADEWDAAREALKTAGDRAAAAQAALDALGSDATDEQRDDALRALTDAEKAVKTAEAQITALSEPTVFSIEGTSNQAVVTATDEGLAVAVRTDGGALIESVTLSPQPPTEDVAEASGIAVRVTGPKAGRYRAGRYWGAEPEELVIDEFTFSALKADPAFTVEEIDDGT